MTRPPDRKFAEPRLARIYDALEDGRRDLDPYVALAGELGAASVLDIGCGTGNLACRLAVAGLEVAALDPAAASIAVARTKPGADLVRWTVGDVSGLPPLRVDLVTMTGNVAQVFVDDAEWEAALGVACRSLGADGHVVFETRDPAVQAWRHWTRAGTRRVVDVAGVGPVETWVEVTEVSPPLVTFRQTFVFHDDGAVLTSDSTLVFRDRAGVQRSLEAAGLTVLDVRDAPDRPGLELVFVAGPLRP